MLTFINHFQNADLVLYLWFSSGGIPQTSPIPKQYPWFGLPGCPHWPIAVKEKRVDIEGDMTTNKETKIEINKQTNKQNKQKTIPQMLMCFCIFCSPLNWPIAGGETRVDIEGDRTTNGPRHKAYLADGTGHTNKWTILRKKDLKNSKKVLCYLNAWKMSNCTNKTVCATIRTRWKIQCLPYAGFVLKVMISEEWWFRVNKSIP